ncbi:MAG: hypothetical protein QOH61_1411 [Chloroflexota bacterium]|jgi:hypothetical protein|nr:hypothetical protein [Chloroflexota bacterium]
MTEPAIDPCAALKSEIDSLQKEFEQVWMAISAGGGDPARYRVLREQLGEKRIKYNRECGHLTEAETSTLPKSVTADWRAG